MLVVGSLPRRPLQWKRLIKIELCVWLSVVQLSQVGHVVQNRQSALSLAWHEWFSCKGEEWNINCCGLASSSEPKIREFKKRPWQLQISRWSGVVIRRTEMKNFNAVSHNRARPYFRIQHGRGEVRACRVYLNVHSVTGNVVDTEWSVELWRWKCCREFGNNT